MRLFVKFFLCSTLVVSVALILSGYLLIVSSHESALNREIDRAVKQYQYDKFIVQANLLSEEDNLGEGIPEGLLDRIASNMSGFTAFYDENKALLYSTLPIVTDLAMFGEVSENSTVYRVQAVDGKSYIMVCGRFNQSGAELFLLTASDISDINVQKEQMIAGFTWIYFLTLPVSIAMSLLLSILITRQLKRMNKAASGIAHGRYSERLHVSSRDEIGELAVSFNMMADKIEEEVSKLVENARQKEDFVANFAHELKTPLTSVIGYADMIYQKDLTKGQIKEASWYILSEGLRLEALSLKLMDLIVLDKQDFILERLNAEEMFSLLAGSLRPMFVERKAVLHLDIQPANVMAEYDLFKTLILNLVDNAIKAGASDIDIIGENQGERYVIRVRDNGRGMPESELSRITEAFYMVDKSRSRKQYGAGLGLSLAAKIARIHGSAPKFSSKVGVGTTVRFSLAIATEGEDED